MQSESAVQEPVLQAEVEAHMSALAQAAGDDPQVWAVPSQLWVGKLEPVHEGLSQEVPPAV